MTHTESDCRVIGDWKMSTAAYTGDVVEISSPAQIIALLSTARMEYALMESPRSVPDEKDDTFMIHVL